MAFHTVCTRKGTRTCKMPDDHLRDDSNQTFAGAFQKYQKIYFECLASGLFDVVADFGEESFHVVAIASVYNVEQLCHLCLDFLDLLGGVGVE